jgi:hypothetical protein
MEYQETFKTLAKSSMSLNQFLHQSYLIITVLTACCVLYGPLIITVIMLLPTFKSILNSMAELLPTFKKKIYMYMLLNVDEFY